jgi:hypothetical protein
MAALGEHAAGALDPGVLVEQLIEVEVEVRAPHLRVRVYSIVRPERPPRSPKMNRYFSILLAFLGQASACTSATVPTDRRPEQADAAGGTLEHHPELPGNTVSCAPPRPFALVSDDATDGGDVRPVS